MDPITLAALVGAFLLFKKPAAPAAASVKPGAGNSGPQATDVGNPISGAPVYNLAAVLAGRHVGVDNSGPQLPTPGTSTSLDTAAATTGSTPSNLNIWNGGVQVPQRGPYYDQQFNQYASSGFGSNAYTNISWASFIGQVRTLFFT